MARGPAEVLVAVGVEFYRVRQSLFIGVRSSDREVARHIPLSQEILSYVQRRDCVVVHRAWSARIRGGGLRDHVP
jgi:hypothetical protein